MPFFTDAQLRELSAEFPRFTTSRNLGRGTAFPATADVPGGLRADDTFRRTDLDWDCFYDGTRWLTNFEMQISEVVTTFTATNNSAFDSVFRTDYAPFITRIVVVTSVATTNNATNFWTIGISGVNLAKGAATTIYSFTTAAHTLATLTLTEVGGVSLTNQVLGANAQYWRVSVTTTLAPGTLTIHPTTFYRLIVT